MIIKRGKANKGKIRSLDEASEGYKYLGIIEADDIKHSGMEEIVQKEYYCRVRKILKSKLNGGNTIATINSRAVLIARHGAGIINWSKNELEEIDRKTRELLTTHRSFHPQADIDRLFMSRKEGGRGQISTEDSVYAESESLSQYVDKSKERVMQAVAQENVLKRSVEFKGMDAVWAERKRKLLERPLHGQFFKGTADCWRTHGVG